MKYLYLLFAFSALMATMLFVPYSNYGPYISDRVWAHKVNSLEDLANASEQFTGVELDIHYNQTDSVFYICHDLDACASLTLDTYFAEKKNGLTYWLDFKNLDEGNLTASCNRLQNITARHTINRTQIIIESKRPELTQFFASAGYKTSYYLPEGLHRLQGKAFTQLVAEVTVISTQYRTNYLSSDYKDYPIMDSVFPNREKLLWHTCYCGMGKIDAHTLLVQALTDTTVKAILVGF